jgi:DNA-binding XRE family transcriptional regulator
VKVAPSARVFGASTYPLRIRTDSIHLLRTSIVNGKVGSSPALALRWNVPSDHNVCIVVEVREQVRAYKLAEIRRSQHMTQAVIAQGMGVARPRVSAIEHGRLDSTELGTLRSYVEALGGRLRVIADFGDEFIVVQG